MAFREIGAVKKKSTLVAEQIIEGIKRGEYREGDRLPPERELAKQMKVSRTSIREALSALQIIGIIESKTGDGTYVSSHPIGGIDREHLLILIEEGADLLEIWRAREGIEICLSNLAITRATPEEIERIKIILERRQKALDEKDYELYLSTNADFHLAIAEMAHSPPLKQALASLLKVAKQILRILGDVERDYVAKRAERTFKIHKDILNAIEKQDKDAVNSAIRLHFQDLIDYLRQEFIF